MSSRAVFSALLMLIAAVAIAADWGTLAAGSDRTLDTTLVSALNTEDFGTAIMICEGIGRRGEPYAGDVIASLAAGNPGRTDSQRELLLRILLEKLFDPARDEPAIQARIAANSEELDSLVGRIAQWKDPQLVGVLVRVLPSLPGKTALPALAEAGSRAIDELRQGMGLVSPQEGALLDFLSSVERISSEDFLEQCTAIARLSRDKVIVDRARAIARAIASQ
jgi:hypothetical protein